MRRCIFNGSLLRRLALRKSDKSNEDPTDQEELIDATSIFNRSLRRLTVAAVGLLVGTAGSSVNVAMAAWGVLSDMHNYHECFGLDPQASNYPNSGTSPKVEAAGKVQSRDDRVELRRATSTTKASSRFSRFRSRT